MGATITEMALPAYGAGSGLELPFAARSAVTARGPGGVLEPLTGVLTKDVLGRYHSPIAFGSQTICHVAPPNLWTRARGEIHSFVPPPYDGFTFSCAIVKFPKN
jgi:hypothetical protein